MRFRTMPIARNLPAYLRYMGIVVTIIAATLGAVYLAGSAVYDVEGLSLRIGTIPSLQGKTVIDLSPFGSISAHTHRAPFQLHFRPEYIGTELAKDLLDSHHGDSSTLLAKFQGKLSPLALSFILRQVIVGLVTSLIMVWLIWRTSWRQTIYSGIIGGLVIMLLLVTGMRGYDLNAFKEPEYNGVIALAPNLIPEPEELIERINQVGDQTRVLVNNIQTLMASVNGMPMLGDPQKDDGVKKILLMGDLHSNPVGIEFIKGLARSFNVDFIIDTGDLTDFGSPLEAKFADGLKDLGVPYVFAPGNHDNPEIVKYVKSLKTSIILNNKTVTVKDLTVLGNADPLASSQEVVEEDQAKWYKMTTEQAAKLLEAGDLANPPDLVVVHNPQTAKKLAGHFPLIITGHTHKQHIETIDGTLIINPGSAGAEGVRGLYTDKTIPYSAIILYIKPGEKPIAADTIKYDLLSDRFYIERKLLNQPYSSSKEAKAQSLSGSY